MIGDQLTMLRWNLGNLLDDPAIQFLQPGDVCFGILLVKAGVLGVCLGKSISDVLRPDDDIVRIHPGMRVTGGMCGVFAFLRR
jgi:hypothetical protein